MGGLSGQGKNLAMMAAPFATGAFSSPPETPEQDTGSIRQSDWNPKDRFTARDPVKASGFKGFAPSIYGSRFREGGVMRLANGGMVRLAEGGIAGLYQELLGRGADNDTEGMQYWQSLLDAGVPLDAIREGIAGSQEAQARVAPQQPPPTSTADTMYTPGPGGVNYAQGSLDNMYRELLGRPVDQDGLNYWTQALAAGASAADISNAIKQSEEYRNKPFQGTADTASNAAGIMPTGDTPQKFTSPVQVYPHPVGYNTQISYDSKGDRVYTYTPDGSDWTNVPSYEGSKIGSPLPENNDHPLLQSGAGGGLEIGNVTAGHISNIISALTGERPTTQDVYDVWGV
jgi:hypothetical protein